MLVVKKILEGDGAAGFEEAEEILKKALEPDTGLPKVERFFSALTLSRIELDGGDMEEAAHWMERAEAAGVEDKNGRLKTGACARSAYHAALKSRLLIESEADPESLRSMLERMSEEHYTMKPQFLRKVKRKSCTRFH